MFEAILDTLEQQVAVTDALGDIVWVNRAWTSFSLENGGNPNQTWRNVNYLETCTISASSDDKDVVEIKEGINDVINGVIPSFNFEYPCHSPNEKRWFMMSVRPFVWDGQSYFVFSHLNITDRKLSEIGQKEINDLYEESQRIGKVGSWKLDMRQNANDTLHWSSEAFNIFGVPSDTTKQIKEVYFEVMHPRDRLRVKKAYKTSITEKKPYEIEYRIVTKDRSEKHLVERGNTIFNAKGQPQVSAGTVQDITTKRLMEQEKSDFVSMVIHEFRTPLTSIKGSLGLLNSESIGKIPTKIETLLEIVGRNTDRLMLLLNDILDADKLASGKMDFHKERLDLAKLVREHAQAEKGFGDEFGVTFDVSGADNQIWIDGDKQRLEQVMANLLSNAAKFSNQGDVIDISLKLATASQVRVSVCDKGPGIPESQRARIFERFVQVGGQTPKNGNGTGLGLAIAKLIVEEHGGVIDVASEIGKGTTFFFELATLDE